MVCVNESSTEKGLAKLPPGSYENVDVCREDRKRRKRGDAEGRRSPTSLECMCLPLIHFSTMLTEAYLQPVYVCTHTYVRTNNLQGAAEIFTLSVPDHKM